MTDTQHTPGPWTVYRGVQHQGEFIIFKGITDIAVTRFADGDCNANARLIAAAPELLALLAEAVARVEDLINGHESAVEDLAAWSDDARAAIIKATGGQS